MTSQFALCDVIVNLVRAMKMLLYKRLARNWTKLLSELSYLETGVSYWCQIWQQCLQWNVTECCKMQGLQLLSFLIYKGKTNSRSKLTPHPLPPTHSSSRLGLNNFMWYIFYKKYIFHKTIVFRYVEVVRGNEWYHKSRICLYKKQY